MEFNQQTKIAAIINYNKASIDAIAGVAPPLRKLKNPVLRKVMASRVTVAEAAKMGGCSVAELVQALEPLGYHFAASTAAAAPSLVIADKPGWLTAIPETAIHFFDVRSIIEGGADPLKAIMQQFKETAGGTVLCIINSFVPTPLIHLLEKKQAAGSYVEMRSEKEVYTYFLKKGEEKTAPVQASAQQPAAESTGDFERCCNRFGKEQLREIDVRALEMPGPMQAILKELETLPADTALFVHHKRVPVYLLEELADKDFEVHLNTIAEGNVKMLLFRKTGI